MAEERPGASLLGGRRGATASRVGSSSGGRALRRSAGADMVQVVGLAEFQRELRRIGPEWPKELRKANLGVAKNVERKARARAQALGSTAAHVARSLKAAAEQRRAKVAVGNNRFPAALGQNFGARHNRPRPTSRGPVLGWNQFPEVTEPDRVLYRTIRAEGEETLREYESALDVLHRRAFPT